MARRRFNKRHALMLRWIVPSSVATGVVIVLLTTGAAIVDPAAPEQDGSIAGLTSVLTRSVPQELVTFSFVDSTMSAGINFRHMQRERRSLLPEDMGPGLAWGDYDNDGDPDLFFANYADDADQVGQDACALYRNNGDGSFTDVSKAAGLNLRLPAMAGAWGDYDNDDDLDLVITAFGANRLMRNNGDGSFSDVTSKAGVGDTSFSTGATWGDFNTDGLIDLYICNYVQFEVSETDRARTARQYGAEIPFTINPSAFASEPNRLYRNNGDGTFTDVADEAGVANPNGRSLGASWFDIDNDGLLDLYIANDVSANGVFRNTGDSTFADIGAMSLAADYRGAMGLAVGDVDRDGDQDLFVTHWVAQENAFFDNMSSERWPDGKGGHRVFFMDSADVMGLGQISLKTVGWSAGFADFDNDAWLDLWVVNGNTMQNRKDSRLLLPQATHLFRQVPERGFFDIAPMACPGLPPIVGRGGAHADYNGDGRVDLCISVHGASPILLTNTSVSTGNWITVRLRQKNANTRALGAVVSVTANGVTQTKQIGTGGAYLSQNDTDLHFGLGEASAIESMTIRWPDGTIEQIDAAPLNQTLKRTRIH